jgi:hypothetical protein
MDSKITAEIKGTEMERIREKERWECLSYEGNRSSSDVQKSLCQPCSGVAMLYDDLLYIV